MKRELDNLLNQPDAREAMEAGIAAWREGNLRPHQEIVKETRRRKIERWVIPAIMAALFIAAMLGYSWAGFVLLGAVCMAALHVAWQRIKEAS